MPVRHLLAAWWSYCQGKAPPALPSSLLQADYSKHPTSALHGAMTPLLAVLLVQVLPLAWCQLGGRRPVTVDPRSPEVQFAVQAINNKFVSLGDRSPRTLVTVVNATTQVVAGTKLSLYLHVRGGPQDEYCDVTLWIRPWISPSTQLTRGPTCSQTLRVKRSTGNKVGARSKPQQLNAKTPSEVTGALSSAVCSADPQFYAQLGDVSGATYTSQVTAGVTFRFYNVTVRLTSCARLDDSDCSKAPLLSACALSGTKSCDFVVQWRAWEVPAYSVTATQCK